MEIRPIQANNNKAIAALIRSVFIDMGVPKKGTAYEDKELDNMYETYLGERSVYYLVLDENKILGGAGISPLKDEATSVCELQKMYFSPTIRGKGIGFKVIQKCLDFAKVNEFTICYIETTPIMHAAQRLYKKVGFNYIVKPLGNTGHSSCSIWMTKSLI